MTKLIIDVRHYFKFDRITKLAQLDWHDNLKESSKLTEEMLELLEELISVHNTPTLIEEAYDVFNCALSVYLSITKFNNIEQTYDMVLTQYNTCMPFDRLSLLSMTRKNNSFQHINTNYQSKSGLKSTDEYMSLLQIIIGDSLNTIMLYLNENIEDDVEELFTKKLDKWEAKYI